MENFFKYLTSPLKPEDVEIWFRINNIIPEKLDLFFDFSKSLNSIIVQTYLGNEDNNSETNIKLTEEDKSNHFTWCWNKNIENFEKEKLFFNKSGEHFEYFKNFFNDIFYNHKEKLVRESIVAYLEDLFDIEKSFTKYDLEMLGGIYKSLDNNLKF